LPEDDNIAARPRDPRSAHGYSLVELMVAMALFLGVMATVVPIVITTVRAEPRTSKRANDIQRARTTVERIVRDLRSGFAIDVASPSQLMVRTYTRKVICGGPDLLPSNQPATPCRVTYTCGGGTCVRAEDPTVGTAGTAETLVEGLASDEVFDYSPSASRPGYVAVSLVFPNGAGDDTITLEDGVDLRNLGPGA
jgi:prepilin-type N-terminal cleavage/methylation domain-containing protein